MKLSAVILCKNEESTINRALSSVAFCDEIIVIDDFSTDTTLELIAKHKKIHLHQRALNGDFAAQRNFGLKKTRGDWILFVDADEEVSDDLRDEITASLTNNAQEAYYIKRRDFWWGRELRFGEVSKVRRQGLIRLVQKNSGRWKGSVHEVFLTAKNTGHLTGFLNHHPHPTLAQFLDEVNFYSSIRADELSRGGRQFSLFRVIIYPPTKFFLNYFLKAGFLDGPAGFAYAFLMAFHSFLVQAKLYK